MKTSNKVFIKHISPLSNSFIFLVRKRHFIFYSQKSSHIMVKNCTLQIPICESICVGEDLLTFSDFIVYQLIFMFVCF